MKSVEGADNRVVFRDHELFDFEPVPGGQRGGDILVALKTCAVMAWNVGSAWWVSAARCGRQGE